MDLNIKTAIKDYAEILFSENLIKAKARINAMNEPLKDPNVDHLTKAALHENIRGSMHAYEAFTRTQITKRLNALNELYAKYPSIDQNDIVRYLHTYIKECELSKPAQ